MEKCGLIRGYKAVVDWEAVDTTTVSAIIELKVTPKEDRVVALTEFGGYSCALTDHRFNPDEEYGYQKYATAVEFQRALSKLYRNDILPQIPNGLCGTILTQVSDVEDETNGLVTYDRMVLKADREEMQAIAAAMQEQL